MTNNNCCGGCGHDDEMEVEFSREVQDAIAKYVLLMQEYDIPLELSAEELIQARIQTIYEEGGNCEDEECDEDHNSPITTFMHTLLAEAVKKKELNETDIKHIAEVATSLDEAAYKDFIRITEGLKLEAEDEEICENCTGVCHVGYPKYSKLHTADGIMKDESDDLEYK